MTAGNGAEEVFGEEGRALVVEAEAVGGDFVEPNRLTTDVTDGHGSGKPKILAIGKRLNDWPVIPTFLPWRLCAFA